MIFSHENGIRRISYDMRALRCTPPFYVLPGSEYIVYILRIIQSGSKNEPSKQKKKHK
jgi:hypothetical protein